MSQVDSGIQGMKFFLVVALATTLCICTARASEPPKLPAEVDQALAAPDQVVLYSLEPGAMDEVSRNRASKAGQLFHDNYILGTTPLNKKQTQVAVAAFKSAIIAFDGTGTGCFDPRHGLHVVFHQHIFDLLLCYECGYLVVYEDDKCIWRSRAAGSPKVLNDLLTAAHVPLSEFYSEASIKAREAQEKADQAERDQWDAVMPKSLRPLLMSSGNGKFPSLGKNPDQTLLLALSAEFPDENQRILALLSWYGGSAHWSGHMVYLDLPSDLLYTFSTQEIVSAMQSEPLSETQLEGAACFFSSGNFFYKRPGEVKKVPPSLRKALLDHVIKSKDPDKIEQVQKAFQ